MDNFSIKVICRHKPMFLRAIEMAFSRDRLRLGGGAQNIDGEPEASKAEAYATDPKGGLTFFWSPKANIPGVRAMPEAMSWAAAAEFAWQWLTSDSPPPPPGPYGDSPDIWKYDGWEVYTDGWGHAADSPYGIVSVRRAVAWIGP